MAVVYLHKKKTNGEVFYVGIGKTLRRPYRKDQRSAFWKRIVEIHDFDVIILVENISWEDACEIECLLIDIYGRRIDNSGALCNMTLGGEGAYGRKLTVKQKKKISEFMTDFYKLPENYLPNITKAWDSNRGRKLTEAHKDFLRKPVLQFTREGIFIKEYKSMTDARLSLNSTNLKISEVCLGKRKTAGGYIWKYKN